MQHLLFESFFDVLTLEVLIIVSIFITFSTEMLTRYPGYQNFTQHLNITLPKSRLKKQLM